MSLKTVKIGSATAVVDTPSSLGSSGLISLVGGNGVTGATSTQYQSFWDNTLSAYTVTTGKNLWLFSLGIIGSAANVGPTNIGYANVSASGSASLPTGGIVIATGLTSLTAGVITYIPIWLKIPGTKIPFYRESAAGGMYFLLGFEE